MFAQLLNRNLLLLFGCQTMFVSGTVVQVTVGGIIGHRLAPDPTLATLPVALMVVGTAVATIPAALTMQAIGRRYGFMIGAGIALLGAYLVTVALSVDNFVLFSTGTFLMGSSLGFSQQFRFAAAESVSAEAVSYAISFLLMASILGALAAPEIIAFSSRSGGKTVYGTAFQVVMCLYVIAALLMLGLKFGAVTQASAASRRHSITDFLTRPKFVTAVLAGMIGQGVMVYVMTATPLNMNVSMGFSIEDTSSVVRAHVIAMYLPSLLTPWLIGRIGLGRTMLLGTVCLAVTLSIGLAGHQYLHFWGSMVLLGIGWNFLFVSGTTMLTQTYSDEERFKAQATNDFAVFSTSATASLLAGTLLHAVGWSWVLISAVPALLAMLIALVWLSRTQKLVNA